MKARARATKPQDAPATGPRGAAVTALARVAQGGVVDPEAMLALQRTVGNRSLARQPVKEKRVTVYLGSPPPKRPRPKPESAVKQATHANLELAKQIDAFEGMKDPALLDARAATTTDWAKLSGKDRDAARARLEAIEFVAHRRGLKPELPKHDRYTKKGSAAWRRDVRLETAERIKLYGSFGRAMKSYVHSRGDIESDLDVLQAEADAFKREFTGQARQTAEKMIQGSLAAMDDVVASYGLSVDGARIAAARLANDRSTVEDEAKRVINSAKNTDTVNEEKPSRHRFRLAQWADDLRAKQFRVLKLDHRIGILQTKAPMNGKGPEWEEIKRLHKLLHEARADLAKAWISAERLHPVLAAYRAGQPLEKIDLAVLDEGGVDEMVADVLVHVLPKMANSLKALSKVKNDRRFALTLPAVVGLTSANMFIPPGSLRAGAVQDLVEDERDKRENIWVDIAALALAVITLVPSGGASLGIVAGMASVSLAAYSAMDAYDKNQLKKTLYDTHLDRARSLSDEEPSMAGFAWSLVSFGLESVALVQAFRSAKAIRNLVNTGDNVTDAVNDLNRFGEARGIKNLGDEAVEDAEKGLGKQATRTPDKPPVTDDAAKRKADEEAKKKADAEAKKKADAEAKKKPDDAAKKPDAPKKPASVKAKTLGFTSTQDVKNKVKEALAGLAKGMDPATLPKDYVKMLDKLKEEAAKLDKVAKAQYDEITRLTPDVMSALRDPDLFADVLADAWAKAIANDTGINAALLKMASDEGMTVKVISGNPGELNGPIFFDRYAGKPVSVLDKPFAAPDPHGSMIHLVQDLVVNRALKKKGLSSAHYRSLLSKAKQQVKWPYQVAQGEPKVIKMGDYVWRTTYDNTTSGQMNTPERISPILQRLFKLN